MSTEENKKRMDAAVVAAAEKDFTTFKSNIEGVIEDRLKSLIDVAIREKAKTIFQKED